MPALVIDKHPRPGDQWRNRYKSLCLHDPVWYDHLPYLKFPDNWPVFAPKDKIGDWLESYVKVMEVPYWSSTIATVATYSPEAGEWTVEVEREGMPLTLRPQHLVLATGMSGKPNIPDIPGSRRLPRRRSTTPPPTPARTPTPASGWSSIGSNNSAFDICGALWEHDADVTMVQRSSTHIVKSDTLMDIGLGALYSEEAVGRRGDHGEGGPDLRLAAVPDHARVPDPAVRADGASATRTSTTGWRRPASGTTGARTAPGCS